MPKYTVVGGKHTTRAADGSNVYHQQNQTVELSEAEAAKFPDKFKLAAVVEQAKSVTEADKPAAPAAKAPAGGPAPTK